MAKTPKTDSVTITLTPEEIATIMAIREGKAQVAVPDVVDAKSTAQQELAAAFIDAIERTKPPAKKNSFNRDKHGPFEPAKGRVKPKLRRVMYHHGLELHEDTLLPAEIELLNKVKPGSYCNGFVRVIKRKDRALDIDYPMKTAAQRLKLSQQFKITSFESFLQRLIDEAADPTLYKGPEDDD